MKLLYIILIIQAVLIAAKIFGLVYHNWLVVLLPIEAVALFSLTLFVIATIKYARKGVSKES